MIKVDIKSDVLKETKNRIDVGIHVKLNMEGPDVILEEELYKLVKEFENKIPVVWCDVIERVMIDVLRGEAK